MAEAPIKGGLSTNPRDINFYGAQDEDISEYQKSLDDSIKALQQRYAQPNWFNVAAGFFKPQLGGFAASLGSASEAMGQNVERERESQLPIAQMRSQLAMSKIAMGQNKQAADLVKAHEAEGAPLYALPQLAAKLKALGSPLAESVNAQIDQTRKSQDLQVQRVNSAIEQRRAAESLINRDEAQGVLTPAEAGVKRAALPAIPTLPPDPFDRPAQGDRGAPVKAVDLSVKDSAAGTAGPGKGDALADTVAAAKALAGNSAAPPPAAAPPSATTANAIGAQDFLTKAVYPNESPTGAPNSLSTAVGKGQMLKGTRQFIKEKYNMQAGIDQYEKDPAVAAAYDYALLGHNHGLLKDPTTLNHRLMWWFGTGDGPKILDADPSKKLKDLGLSLKENKEEPKKDGYKINRLTPDMSVGEVRAQMAGQLRKSGVDPDAKVVFGEPPKGVEAAAVPVPAAAAPAPKPAEQERFPVMHARPTGEGELRGKSPDERALIIKAAEEKAKADESRADGFVKKWSGYGDPTIYTPYMGELSQSISMIEGNKPVAKKVFNAMGQGDLQAQLLKAANEGFTFNGGVWSGSVNLPVKAWVDAGLSPEEATYANKMATMFLRINGYKGQLQNMSTSNPPVAEFSALQNRGANLGQPWDAALSTLKKDRINGYWSNKIYNIVLAEKEKAGLGELAPTAAVLKHSKEYKAADLQWKKDLQATQ
jgi:hypothetical protein